MPTSLLKTIGVVAVLLLVIWGVSLKRQVPAAKMPFSAFVDNAAGLRLEREFKSVEFVKKEAAWKVKLNNGTLAPAQENQLSSLLGNLKSLALEDVISTRPDQAADFGVTDSSGTHVTLQDANGKPLISATFGKMASDFRHIFYRLKNSSDVYMALGLYEGQFGVMDPLAWRERQLVNIPESQIKGIRIESKGKVRDYVRVSTEVWTLNGKAIPPDVPNRLVGTLAHLTADSFVTPEDHVSLTYPTLSFALIRVQGDGQPVTVHFGLRDKKTPRYPLATNSESGVAWLSEPAVRSLLELK